MAPNTSPIFVLTPNNGFARPGAANLTSDGSGTCPTVFTAGAAGSRVEHVYFFNGQATAAASSAMVVRLFLTDTSGANPKLIDEQVMGAATRSVTVVGAAGEFPNAKGLTLLAGALLKVVQSVYASAADQVDFTAVGGDF